jgi:hypothetical protein
LCEEGTGKKKRREKRKEKKNGRREIRMALAVDIIPGTNNVGKKEERNVVGRVHDVFFLMTAEAGGRGSRRVKVLCPVCEKKEFTTATRAYRGLKSTTE